jgi:hypothetical protein
VNYFADHTGVSSELLDIPALQQRMNYMAKLVYPAILNKVTKKQKTQQEAFNKKHLIVTTQYHPGAVVYIKNDLRGAKSDQKYEGPFTILRRTRGGSYILQGPEGTEYTRSASQLKLGAQDAVNIPAPNTTTAEVQKIVSHRQMERNNPNTLEYQVKWKGFPDTFNSWIPVLDLNAQDAIKKYHDSLKAPARVPEVRQPAKKRKVDFKN